jgi:hypothetical protein
VDVVRMRAARSADVAFAAAGLVLAAAVIGLSLLAEDAGDAIVRNTIRLSLAWYAAALALMMRLRAEDWRGGTRTGQAARWCWTWGCVIYLVHVAAAFHYVHDWSHGNAFAHTREASGVGEGLFVSYLFTAVWTADAAMWWLAPDRYARRPAWVHRLLHGFMLFIVFNGTVVFESGPLRWIALLGLAALAVLWWWPLACRARWGTRD